MRLVIIGGGAGGMSAAAQARRADPKLEIVVLEKSAEVSVGLCGLPYFVGDQVQDPRKLITHTPAYFRQERNIDVRIHHRVERIHQGQRVVAGSCLASGEPFEVKYDRLVYATGAGPARLDVPGANLPHVFVLRTLADGIRLKARLAERTDRRAVVIGAGYIGLEVAEALRHWGLSVTVVEARERPLVAFDPWVGSVAADLLTAHGVTLQLGQMVTRIEPGAVVTREAGNLAADLVVVAVGNDPDVALLHAAGAEVGRSGALVVGRQMQTNLPSVWAAGDCAESRFAVTGRGIHVPLGSVANLHGRVAGDAAAGRRGEATPVAATHLLKLFELGLARAGLSEQEARRLGFEPVSAEVAGPVRAQIFGGGEMLRVRLTADARTGHLLGGQVVGPGDAARRIDVVATLLVSGATVGQAAGLDLGYTPPLGVARDPLGQAAQRLLAELERVGRR